MWHPIPKWNGLCLIRSQHTPKIQDDIIKLNRQNKKKGGIKGQKPKVIAKKGGVKPGNRFTKKTGVSPLNRPARQYQGNQQVRNNQGKQYNNQAKQYSNQAKQYNNQGKQYNRQGMQTKWNRANQTKKNQQTWNQANWKLNSAQSGQKYQQVQQAVGKAKKMLYQKNKARNRLQLNQKTQRTQNQFASRGIQLTRTNFQGQKKQKLQLQSASKKLINRNAYLQMDKEKRKWKKPNTDSLVQISIANVGQPSKDVVVQLNNKRLNNSKQQNVFQQTSNFRQVSNVPVHKRQFVNQQHNTGMSRQQFNNNRRRINRNTQQQVVPQFVPQQAQQTFTPQPIVYNVPQPALQPQQQRRQQPRKQQNSLQQALNSLRPSVATKYNFNTADFAKGNTQLSLSDRFAGMQSTQQQPQPQQQQQPQQQISYVAQNNEDWDSTPQLVYQQPLQQRQQSNFRRNRNRGFKQQQPQSSARQVFF